MQLGPLVRKIGHLVRNKLAVLGNSTYYLKLRLGDTDQKITRHLCLMEDEVALVSAVIADLMDFVMVKEPARRPLDINQLVSDTLAELALPAPVELVTELTPGLPLLDGDPAQLARALNKLLVNAVEAMTAVAPGGRLTVRTGLSDEGQTVWVTVSDTGPGLPTEDIDRLFDPLFTTKAQGFGLGLPIARGFIERHGGRLVVSSNPGEGTTCTMILPLGIR
jgi:signal transduction histidine kinase